MSAAAAEVAAQQPVTAQVVSFFCFFWIFVIYVFDFMVVLLILFLLWGQVASAFVIQYYHILHQTPEHVYRFYQDISKLGRPQEDGTMTITTTMEVIPLPLLLNVCEV